MTGSGPVLGKYTLLKEAFGDLFRMLFETNNEKDDQNKIMS